MTLRIGMIGPGGMGRAHIERIHTVISGGRVVGVSDVNVDHAAAVAEQIGGVAYTSAEELVASPDIDAVMICSFGEVHEPDVITAIEAGKYVFCEKPLAPTAAECVRIMEVEQRAGKKLVTVGFMRRFDASYNEMKQILDAGEVGEALMVHCAHRNPSVPDGYTRDMAIHSTAIHEIDTMRWLLDEEFVSVRVDKPKKTSNARPDLQDPLVLILTTESGVRVDDEVFVSCGYGYDIQCELVAENGVVRLGDQELVQRADAIGRRNRLTMDHNQRFGAAFTTEVQQWITAVSEDRHTGSSSWDGYAAAVVCDASVQALNTDTEVAIAMMEKPALYR
ncbi:Gfo/Idh/MocA family protein [Tessaracoccus caeni]|uniref:Gfo/Idh/MocA family protein n=1 Tax=Tessaracoccus caeni TaxID=3031239 RepID=UPI0023DA34EF|nr:Gfo/Idh/MocA family oxidoreductase [Tessaracoccus caeni]MDF1488073.1 Gfo/Idh/MocA family oxidoreductase [Tessaracoccus caeni]